MHLWYQNAIFYSLDTETFYDAGGDGVGDFSGLIERLDYIASLGVTCIWLQPFFPSPDRDSGYDVTDYYNVDQRLGNLGLFSEFMDKAAQYGIRIVIDLVVNHTSVKHPWFQEARRSVSSRYRDYYVWSDKPKPFTSKELMLPGEEHTIWTYDKAAGQYYLHHFYKEQPDLNIGNPKVREEILRIMGFWLRMGVAGFRIDAVQFLIDSYGTAGEAKPFEDFLTEMRTFLSLRKSEAILIAETNLAPKDLPTYIDGGSRMHMGFNFYVNQHLFLALAKERAEPLQEALLAMPPLNPHCQMLSFLRHHDELSLKLLTKREQDAIHKRFAPEDDMRIFESGIRRRLAPLLGGNRKLIELAYSLMFSLPGVPLIRYGEEIGMGDDLTLDGRNSVRTPMQWSESDNGGFSVRKRHTPLHPVIKDGLYSFKEVNVCKAQRESDSLLNWLQRLIILRKRFPHIGIGDLKIIQSDHPGLFIHTIEWNEDLLLFMHNLSGAQMVIPVSEFTEPGLSWIPLFSGNEAAKDTDDMLVLEGYDYKWMRLDNGK